MPRMTFITTAAAALLLLPVAGRAESQADNIARAFAELGEHPTDAQCHAIGNKHFMEPGVALAILTGPCSDFTSRGIEAVHDKQRNSL